jgi:sugar/nucleoside kinase (ribokinase family)
LVIGDCGIDLVLVGEHIAVEFGQVERLVDEARLTLGGSAAITAAGAARLEMRTVLASTVGDDLFGSFATSELKARGVDLRGLSVRQDHATGVTVVLSRGDDRAILTAVGSIPTLRPEDLADEWLSRARHVHVSSYFLLDELRAHLPGLFRRAHSESASTSLDTNWDPRETWDGDIAAVLEHTDYLLVNEAEVRALARARDLAVAIETLARSGTALVVKKGSLGAALCNQSRCVAAEAFPIDAVDTTGAGDSFASGFIAGVLHGYDGETSLKVGCACGALSTRAPGGIPAQPTWTEVCTLTGIAP